MTIPPFLKPGALILVISPSFSANESEVLSGIQKLRNEGFQVETGRHVFSRWGKFAGTDGERLSDLQWALDHPDAQAIVCTRGGYGLSRIIGETDFTRFQLRPKWVIGFSDVTLLHSAIQNHGIASLHGPMAVHFARKPQEEACAVEIALLRNQLTTLSYPVTAARLTGSLPVQAPLLGGNLTLLSHQAGSKNRETFSGAIVFLEEVGEFHYRIDRMVKQLLHSGLLDEIAAVVLGQFTGCEADFFPLSIQEMVLESTSATVPVFYGLESGHGEPTFPLVLGHETRIVRSDSGFRLIQQFPVIS